MSISGKHNRGFVSEDIAIIGMSCIFPGASDIKTYWQNILSKVDCITDALPELWDLGVLYDPNTTEKDRVYCKRGGFLQEREREFNPLKYGIMPTAVEGSEPDQFLALRVAYEAMADAGYLDHPKQKDRTAVILGRGAYVNAGLMNLVQHGWVVEQTLQILKRLHPEYTEHQLKAIKKELVAGLPPLIAEMVPGQVPNIAAGRIANRLDLKGPSYTVDAACASSLIAVDMGLKLLRSRECDLAIVGGMQGGNTVLSYLMFCLINVLSRRSQIRPFDKHADGTILGEGVGMVVLKRLLKAEQDGDRIYALIKGVGTSSDGRAVGLLAPRLEGVELAVRRAYEATGLSPSTVSFLEAHGTATSAGDMTEVNAFRRVFGNRDGRMPWCAIGSVKSMIGHLLGASGIAGLIKAVLALHHKVLPPTLNCTEPNPKLELEKTSFYINTETRPWIHGSKETHRRAGVNCMGFGGINAHAILEEFTGGNEAESSSYHCRWDSEIFIFQGDSREALIKQAQQVQDYLSKTPSVEPKDLAYTLNSLLGQMPYRLAIIASSLQELEKKMSKAFKRLADPHCARIKSRDGIYFFEKSLRNNGKLAFLFPGEGSQYVNMLSDLCIHFPEVRRRFDQIDEIFIGHSRDYLPSDLIFPCPAFSEAERKAADERLWKMDAAIEAVLTANDALFDLLSHLKIHPDVVLGHSTGEYSSMRASGILNLTDGPDHGQYLLQLNQKHEQLAAENGIPHAFLVAVGTDSAQVASIIDRVNGELYIAMDNCLHQTVVVGFEVDIKRTIEELNRQGLISQILPFDRPYHTPLFNAYAESLYQFYSIWPMVSPSIPIYSCTTTDLFPNDVDEIRKIAVEHWVHPVKFRQTIEKMYADGVRIFVEVGPRGNLTAFVNDILSGRDHVAVATNIPMRSGITQLNHAVGILAAQGVSMNLDYLYSRREPQELMLNGPMDSPHKESETSGSMILSLQFSRLQLKQDSLAEIPIVSEAPVEQYGNGQELSCVSESPSPLPHAQVGSNVLSSSEPRSQIMQEYFRTMEHFLEVQHELMHSFLKGSDISIAAAPTPASTISDRLVTTDKVQDSDFSSSDSFFGAAAQPGHPPGRAQREVPVSSVDSRREPLSPCTPDEAGQLFPSGETTSEQIESRLLALVSRKTGYPLEMLDLSVNIEADLGIDSIKRQEILGELWRNTPSLNTEDLDKAASLKTLQEIIECLSKRPEVDHRAVAATAFQPTQPLIGEVVLFTPEMELVAQRKIDLDEDIFLQHHTLGRQVSVNEKGVTALPVMPLTMSMEMLAEAGALLMPDKVLIGMKNIRAYRWIALEQKSLSLQISARRKPGTNEVEARIQNLEETKVSEENPIVEGTLVFASNYPHPPGVDPLLLQSERPSRWTPEELYSRGMFHGPHWQGVASVDRWGKDGSIATLEVLPTDGFLRSIKTPRFVTDPIVLDAAGQVVGFWTLEHLERNFLVFPYRVKALHIYHPQPPVHQKVRCQARIKLVGSKHVSSDIDMINEDGKLWMRLEAWEDKRFDLPPSIQQFLLSPIKVIPNIRWDAPIASWHNPSSFYCCRIETLFRGDEDFWRRVFAHLILNHKERQFFSNLGKSKKRQDEWLMGRLVAKDAVRMFLKQRYEMELGPVDVEIAQDEYGCPVPQGAWVKQIKAVPALSLAHNNGIAVAIAGYQNAGQKVGIDIEEIRSLEQGFETTAFAPKEVELLDSVTESARQQWVIRFWSAKEAAAKALGRGLAEGPHSLAVQAFDVKTGIVKIALKGKLAEEFPDLARTAMIVYTGQEEKHIFASTICERN